MLNCLFSLVLLVLNFTSVYAGDGGHTVGNGGDISELQIINIWSTLDRDVSICIKKPEACNLLDDEYQKLKKAILQYESRGIISFANNMSQEFLTEQRPGANIVFSRSHLYLENGDPVTYQVLLYIVLKAVLYQSGEDLSSADNISLKIVNKFASETRQIKGFVSGSSFRIFWVNFESKSSFFYFDLPNASYLLNGKIEKLTDCLFQVQSVRAQQTNSPESNLQVSGRFIEECNDGAAYESQLWMDLKLDRTNSQLVLNFDKSKMILHNRRKVHQP